MSSTPVTPVSVSSKITADLSWLKAHAILLVIVIGLILGGIFGVESLASKIRAEESSHWQTVLAVQQQQTKIVQASADARDAELTQVLQAVTAQNAQLATQISRRDQQTKQQVAVDATLSATDAASRLAAQTHAQSGEVSASGSGVAIDLPIARSIVGSLDLLSATQSDVTDMRTQLANETTVATAAQTDAAEQKKLVASQIVQLADADKACKAEVSAVKASARRNSIKWFVRGFAAGFVSGILVIVK